MAAARLVGTLKVTTFERMGIFWGTWMVGDDVVEAMGEWTLQLALPLSIAQVGLRSYSKLSQAPQSDANMELVSG